MSRDFNNDKPRKQAHPSLVPVIGTFVLFVALTIAVMVVDVEPIGPNGSSVGLAMINGPVHNLIGVNWMLYTATEIGGMIPLASMGVFFVVGLVQLIRGKGIRGVDRAILILAVAYVVMLACYVGFDKIAINYRPVIVDGELAPSYPSSHSLLSVGALGCAAVWAKMRLRGGARTGVVAGCGIIGALIVLGRLFSGVHWLTDIVAGVLLGLAIMLAYRYFVFGLRFREPVRGRHARRDSYDGVFRA